MIYELGLTGGRRQAQNPNLRSATEGLAERFSGFFEHCVASRLAPHVETLSRLTAARLRPEAQGDLPGWITALSSLPCIEPARVCLDTGCVTVESAPALDDAARDLIRGLLDALHPWRKGPICLHGLQIDAEWRSDWKWDRLADAVAPLEGRLVADVGCGNGYYGYRALGDGARLVLGIDPTLRFVLQFLAVNHFVRNDRLAVLPLADIDLPLGLEGFDTVFSMGVIYHRRDVAAHLALLRRLLRPGGQLVLETLVLDEPGQRVLIPNGRYAKMRNVHAIPALDALFGWLTDAGLRSIRIVDVTPTTVGEQRATEWMRFQSLRDFLAPHDPARTVEGHPAPVRAVAIAQC
ncbi:MAG: tRNA 5-methoxyuridine(34)/uridine 5-oxyacetic acid(34) synthase CmoB [Thiohalocapsa sp.]